MSRKKETPPKQQMGFYYDQETGNFAKPHSRGSRMCRPTENHPRRKKPRIPEMPERQQWAVLRRMGFSPNQIRRMLKTGNYSALYGEPDQRVVVETQQGGLRICDLRNGDWTVSEVGEQGPAIRVHSVLPPEKMKPGRIE